MHQPYCLPSQLPHPGKAKEKKREKKNLNAFNIKISFFNNINLYSAKIEGLIPSHNSLKKRQTFFKPYRDFFGSWLLAPSAESPERARVRLKLHMPSYGTPFVLQLVPQDCGVARAYPKHSS